MFTVALSSVIWFLLKDIFGNVHYLNLGTWTWSMMWDWINSFPWIPALYTGVFSTGLCLWAEVCLSLFFQFSFPKGLHFWKCNLEKERKKQCFIFCRWMLWTMYQRLKLQLFMGWSQCGVLLLHGFYWARGGEKMNGLEPLLYCVSMKLQNYDKNLGLQFLRTNESWFKLQIWDNNFSVKSYRKRKDFNHQLLGVVLIGDMMIKNHLKWY